MVDRRELEGRPRAEAADLRRRQVVAEEIREHRDRDARRATGREDRSERSEHRSRHRDQDTVDDHVGEQRIHMRDAVELGVVKTGIDRRIDFVDEAQDAQAPLRMRLDVAFDPGGARAGSDDQDVARVAPDPTGDAENRVDTEARNRERHALGCCAHEGELARNRHVAREGDGAEVVATTHPNDQPAGIPRGLASTPTHKRPAAER